MHEFSGGSHQALSSKAGVLGQPALFSLTFKGEVTQENVSRCIDVAVCDVTAMLANKGLGAAEGMVELTTAATSLRRPVFVTLDHLNPRKELCFGFQQCSEGIM